MDYRLADDFPQTALFRGGTHLVSNDMVGILSRAAIHLTHGFQELRDANHRRCDGIITVNDRESPVHSILGGQDINALSYLFP